jgi:hypothetical protein
MFEQKRFAGRHLLTFESQVKLFWKKRGAGVLTLQCNSYLSHVRSFFKISSKIYTSQGIVKKKRTKPTKTI